MSDELLIDGSAGEGGGQIVRSSLALSLVTGRGVRIDNIRAGRSKPGLMQQHLTSIRAAAEVGDAELSGDALGSRWLAFRPRTIRYGRFHFSVGTAGSATLVLQTVLPALAIADGPSDLTLDGGTHNPWAPPYDFLCQAFFPLVNRLGPRVAAALERHGFYPAGGGRISVGIEPAQHWEGFDLLERGALVRRSITAIVSNLPRHIAEREAATASDALDWPQETQRVYEVRDALGPGNVVMIEVAFENVKETFTGFGQKGVKAERVARDAAAEASTYLATDAPVGRRLADQWLLPLSVAAWRGGRGGRFRTLPLSGHSTTHIDLLRRFLDVPIRVEPSPGGVEVAVGD